MLRESQLGDRSICRGGGESVEKLFERFSFIVNRDLYFPAIVMTLVKEWEAE
jgi:hypothetical protein